MSHHPAGRRYHTYHRRPADPYPLSKEVAAAAATGALIGLAIAALSYWTL